ncbi:MAG: hypothetical protein GY928_30740 [Colwellia sp.]|nr:hypothetical protein [Colwellia sp.]
MSLIAEFNRLTIYKIVEGGNFHTFKLNNLVYEKIPDNKVFYKTHNDDIYVCNFKPFSILNPLLMTININWPDDGIDDGCIIIMIRLKICNTILNTSNMVLPVLYMVINFVNEVRTEPDIAYKIIDIKVSPNVRPLNIISTIYNHKTGVIPFVLK